MPRKVSFKREFIINYLKEKGEAYVLEMYREWKRRCFQVEHPAGTYETFRKLIYQLKKQGIIEPVRVEPIPYGFDRVYYRLREYKEEEKEEKEKEEVEVIKSKKRKTKAVKISKEELEKFTSEKVCPVCGRSYVGLYYNVDENKWFVKHPDLSECYIPDEIIEACVKENPRFWYPFDLRGNLSLVLIAYSRSKEDIDRKLEEVIRDFINNRDDRIVEVIREARDVLLKVNPSPLGFGTYSFRIYYYVHKRWKELASRGYDVKEYEIVEAAVYSNLHEFITEHTKPYIDEILKAKEELSLTKKKRAKRKRKK